MKFQFEPLSEDSIDALEYDFVTLPTDDEQHEEPQEDTFNTDFLETIYAQIESWIVYLQSRTLSTLPPAIQKSFTNMRQNMRLLTRLLRHSRYPRLALIGRRGAGKSSLMNAILGQQVSTPGHVKAQAKILLYRRADGSGMDVLDTRGLNEGGRPEEDDVDASAVDSIIRALNTCPVDAILFVHKIKEVDAGVEADVRALEQVLKQTHTLGCPVIVVLTHCDEIEPGDVKRPADYDDEKLDSISAAKELFLKNVSTISPSLHQRIIGVVPVSCSVIWLKPYSNTGEILPHPTRDYRYNLDVLMDLLLDNVKTQSIFRTVQACRILRVKVDFAIFLTRTFASIAAVMALFPVPAADVIPTTGLITYLAYTIARLSDGKLGYDAVTRFLGIIGITGIAGFGARYMLSQVMRMFFASAASAAISYSMVTAVGKSAIAFYLEGKSDQEVRDIFSSLRSSTSVEQVEADLEMEDMAHATATKET